MSKEGTERKKGRAASQEGNGHMTRSIPVHDDADLNEAVGVSQERNEHSC